MDVQRSPEVKKKKKRRQMTMIFVALAALAGITYGVSNLEKALPAVERASVYIRSVESGPFVRAVRGPGTLVPEEIRWITAETDGQVEKILIEPGAVVGPESVILVLSNPQLAQQASNAALALRAAESDYANLRVRLASELLTQEADLAQVEAAWKRAKLQAEADEKLYAEGLVPDLRLRQSELTEQEWAVRYRKDQERLQKAKESHAAQLEVQRHRVDQQKSVHELFQRQLDKLEVRPDLRGVLQETPVEEGQRVSPGTQLARVARPDVLKAELRIAETQAKDIAIGQVAKIDTRNGVIPGHVSRIDPAVQQGSVLVDVKLDVAELPRGARPDLSVDGTIELERVDETVYTGRPTYGQAFSTIGLFKVFEDGTAERIPVRLGRISVQFVEILGGLEVGDEVILSDSSQWADRIRLR